MISICMEELLKNHYKALPSLLLKSIQVTDANGKLCFLHIMHHVILPNWKVDMASKVFSIWISSSSFSAAKSMITCVKKEIA